MKDLTGPLTLIDVRNTGFTGMNMLNKANVGPINPKKVGSYSGRKHVKMEKEMMYQPQLVILLF